MSHSQDSGKSIMLGLDTEQLAARGSLFTAQEITQQPRIWREAQDLIMARRDEIDAFLSPLLARPHARVSFCGAGTSAFIGDTLADWLKTSYASTHPVDFESVSTTRLVADPASIGSDRPTLLVSFSRSGDSPESVAAVELASRRLSECRHLIFTCNPNGALARYAKSASNVMCLIMPDGTNDRGFAMTSSYSSMLVSCITVFSPAPDKLEYAAQRAGQIIAQNMDEIADIATQSFDRLVVLGSGLLEGTAREAALKCAELAAGRLVTVSDTPLGFRHGPKIVVSPGTLIVQMISSDPYTRLYDLDLLDELRAEDRAGRIVELSPQRLAPNAKVPLDDIWMSLLYIVYAQALAFRNAWSSGVQIDSPCPSGEVNRVVKGVIIHPYDS